MEQQNLFPKRLTVFALSFLLLVLGFGLYTLIKTSKLIDSFSKNDIPALQMSCAATRVMGETIESLNHSTMGQTDLNFKVQILNDSLKDIILLTSDYPSFSADLINSPNYKKFQTMVERGELSKDFQTTVIQLRGDVQTLIEKYLLKKNEVIQQNIRFGYLSAAVSLVGAIFFFVLIYWIYSRYQKNIFRLQVLSTTLEKERLSTIQSSKLASLGEMAAGLAHEINNPLAVIIGRTEICLAQISDGNASDLEITKAISKISEMANRISKIVSSMRRIAKSSETSELSDLNLYGVIEDVMTLSVERLRSNSIDFDASGLDQGLMALGNFTHLSQVIINLINNSIDELVRSQREQKKIWIKSTVKEGNVFLKVIDSGPGIPSELKEKLFQPFFTTKDVGKGTGLGLSISKSLMQDMGGDLLLEEDEGRTAFVMKLPAKRS